VLARSVLIAQGGVLSAADIHFGAGAGTAAVSTPLDTPGGDERARILAVLDQCGGNQTRAAKVLGISRRTLVNRLDDFGVPRPKKG
jgi:DNA-binding NtrC family response regulator